MEVEGVYIADTCEIMPTIYDSSYLAEQFYNPKRVTSKVHRIAQKLANNFSINQRPTILDLNALPECKVAHQADSPLEWGQIAINHFLQHIHLDEIGYFGIAYNISSHKDILPNLACQITSKANLELETMPMEYAHYGCAGGFLPLKDAISYCNSTQKAAIVFIFDQCLYRAIFNYELHDPLFMLDLKSNLLFSDGAVALLLIPESMRSRFKSNLLKIKDLSFSYKPGNAIGFTDNHFIIGEVKSLMPELVSNYLIKPFLKQNDISADAIEEWSIHQGGTSVLNRFAEPGILGLSEEQLYPSLATFKQYGNLSAPSCFLVLHNIMKKHHSSKFFGRKHGCIVGFGAGYYFGSLLYERIC